jgi:hypothetical protein
MSPSWGEVRQGHVSHSASASVQRPPREWREGVNVAYLLDLGLPREIGVVLIGLHVHPAWWSAERTQTMSSLTRESETEQE